MKLKTKLLLLAGLSVGSLVLIESLSLLAVRHVSNLRETRDDGLELLLQSRSVHGVLEELMFDLFAPETYTLLKDVIHTPRTTVTVRNFREETESFRTAFESFMGSPAVERLASSGRLRDEYETARLLGGRVFERIDAVMAGLRKLQSSGAIGSEGLYARIQTGDDPELSNFFQDIRSASYYFTYTFEGFLEVFVRAVNDAALTIEQRVLRLFWFFTIGLGSVTMVVVLLFAGRTTARIRRLEESVRAVAAGDFSVSLGVDGADELGSLGRSFNRFAQDLETNVHSVLRLTRDVGSALQRHGDLSSVLSMVVDATVNDTRSEAAAVVRYDGSELTVAAASARFPGTVLGALRRDVEEALREGSSHFRPFAGQDGDEGVTISSPETWSVVPLDVGERRLGALCAVTLSSDVHLTRLDHIFLSTFADYAALIVEHYAYYQELLDKREAEYQALQSQIRPHFLYNVLGTIVGLNRVGDTKALETAVLALRGLLHYTLEKEHTVRVSDELDIVTRYCDLQKLRFGERLSFTVECDEEVRDWRLPKLLVQPLVENAVVHGIEPLDRRGRVGVEAKSAVDAPETLVIEIHDNGMGFDPSRIKGSMRVGLENVRSRIALLYPDGSLDIASAPREGTKVTVTLPKAGAAEPGQLHYAGGASGYGDAHRGWGGGS